MGNDDLDAKLEALEAKIEAAKSARADTKMHQEEHHSQVQHGWRMVSEMVAGLGIGFGIGYGLDALFGTTPWLMLIFTLLGIAAGVNVMLRSARELQQVHEARAAREEGDDNGR